MPNTMSGGALGDLRQRANNCHPETRTIRRHVLSVHIKSVVVAAKIAALHHAGAGCRLLVTAFDPPASVDTQSADREI
jgi:hypothetical protein